MSENNGEGRIVNPGSTYVPSDHGEDEGPQDTVGDAADYANDLRFNEEQQLIDSQRGDSEDDDEK